jgi:hypothetical protein
MMSAFPTKQALGQTPALPTKACCSGSLAATIGTENAPVLSLVFPGIATDFRLFPNEKLLLNVTAEAFCEMAGSVSC